MTLKQNGAPLLAGLVLVLSLTGCLGYRVGDVSGRNLQGVRSVYVPVAKNESLEADLQVIVTNAIIQRFNSDGTLEVNQNSNADSELDITVATVKRNAVASSTQNILQTSEYRLTIDGQGNLR